MVKFSADDILKYFSYIYQKTGFDISCKLSPPETICLKCLTCFLRKNKKSIINLSSAEVAHRVVKIKAHSSITISELIIMTENVTFYATTIYLKLLDVINLYGT